MTPEHDCPHESRLDGIESSLREIREEQKVQGVCLARIVERVPENMAVRLDRLEREGARRGARGAMVFGAAVTGMVAGVGSVVSAVWHALTQGAGK